MKKIFLILILILCTSTLFAQSIEVTTNFEEIGVEYTHSIKNFYVGMGMVHNTTNQVGSGYIDVGIVVVNVKGFQFHTGYVFGITNEKFSNGVYINESYRPYKFPVGLSFYQNYTSNYQGGGFGWAVGLFYEIKYKKDTK